MFTVYLHRNKVNGKVYVGITSKAPERRWRNGFGYSDQSLFWKAIVKYGWDNFEHEILFENLTQDDAELLERLLISKYRSNEREFGYNLADGGRVNKGYKLSDETRQRLSRSHIGKTAWNKGLSGYIVPKARGKKRSEEACKKMSDNRPKKSVSQYTLEGEFITKYTSMKEAYRHTGISDGSISAACAGKQKTAGGYLWKLTGSEEASYV